MSRLMQRFSFWLFSMTLIASGAVAQDKLPLDAFAMLPTIKQVSVSPNGEKMGVIRSVSKTGFYFLDIYDTKNLMKKPKRYGSDVMEVTGFNWVNDEKIFLGFRQNVKTANSNRWENRYIILDVKTGDMGEMIGARLKRTIGSNLRDRNTRIRVINRLPHDKNHILLALDIDNDRRGDVVKFNVKTYAMRPVFHGTTKFNAGLFVDQDGDVRGAVSFKPAQKILEYYARVKGSKKWKKIGAYDPRSRESFSSLGFDGANPNIVYISGNFGKNTTGIYMYDLVSDKMSERQFGLKSVDVGGVLQSTKVSDYGKLLGFSYTTDRLKRYFLDADTEALYKAVEGLFEGKQISIRSRSEDDSAMIIYTLDDKDPGTYYLLRNKAELKFLGMTYPLQTPEHLSRVKYIKYKARDGRKIPAYVTYPKGDGPHPTIVLPHGGPWVRDVVIYDQWAQLLAHHGYLIIQPNYRGSTGYGLDHWKVADKEWGLTMQDDLDDAALYLVEKGLADKGRLAMFGWSYGGYAAFVGSMRENNIYKCTVAGAGVSDLPRLRAAIFGSRIARISQRPTVTGVNPLDHVDKVNVPILVVHGDIDERVNVSHSRDFVAKLKQQGKDHKYLEIKGLDHFYSRFTYEHKNLFFRELLNWLDNKCFR